VNTGSHLDVEKEVAAAMQCLSKLTDLASDADANGSVRQLIAAVDAKVFLQFGDEKWGKRTVRKPVGGIVTFGSQRPPIEVYQGATDRRSIKDAKKETAASLAAVTEGFPPSRLLASQEVPSEEDSLGKLHRGDRPYTLVDENIGTALMLSILPQALEFQGDAVECYVQPGLYRKTRAVSR
jgi:hypothetical protein